MRLNFLDDQEGGYVCTDCQNATNDEIGGVYMINVHESEVLPCDVCGQLDDGIRGGI